MSHQKIINVVHLQSRFEFIKLINMQHFGAPDEEGYEILQTVLYYFSPEKKQYMRSLC